MDEAVKKKISNYWYYHKWHTIIGLFLLIIIIISVVQCSTQTKSDAVILLVNGTKSTTTGQQSQLEDILSQYATDYNKDGVSLVSLNVIDFADSSQSEVYVKENQKLAAELLSTDSFLCIVDDSGYKILKQDNVLDKITTIVPNAKATDDYRIKLSDIPAFQNKGIDDLTGSLYIVIRIYKGTYLESSSKDAYYNYNVALLKNLFNSSASSASSSAASSAS